MVAIFNLPGAPRLNVDLLKKLATDIVVTDLYNILTTSTGLPTYGLYYLGIPVIIADTVTSINHSAAWNISTYPVERGQFISYNKVYQPFTATLKFTSGGSRTNRRLLFNSVAAISETYLLYDVVMPEYVYRKVNVVGHNISREASSGNGLINIEVNVEQVKEFDSTPLFARGASQIIKSAFSYNGPAIYIGQQIPTPQ